MHWTRVSRDVKFCSRVVVVKNDLNIEFHGCRGVKATHVGYGLFLGDEEENDTYLGVQEMRVRHAKGISEAGMK